MGKRKCKETLGQFFKYYPLGRILVGKTGLKIQGLKIYKDKFILTEYQYLLDGQQRIASLLNSLNGEKNEIREDFYPVR